MHADNVCNKGNVYSVFPENHWPDWMLSLLL